MAAEVFQTGISTAPLRCMCAVFVRLWVPHHEGTRGRGSATRVRADKHSQRVCLHGILDGRIAHALRPAVERILQHEWWWCVLLSKKAWRCSSDAPHRTQRHSQLISGLKPSAASPQPSHHQSASSGWATVQSRWRQDVRMAQRGPQGCRASPGGLAARSRPNRSAAHSLTEGSLVFTMMTLFTCDMSYLHRAQVGKGRCSEYK